MEDILHQLISSLSHYFQGFIHPRWLAGILSTVIVPPLYGFTKLLSSHPFYVRVFLQIGAGHTRLRSRVPVVVNQLLAPRRTWTNSLVLHPQFSDARNLQFNRPGTHVEGI